MEWMAKTARTMGAGRNFALMAATFALGTTIAGAEGKPLDVGGFAWTQGQAGLTPMFKGAANFDYNPFFGAGGMVFLTGHPSDAVTTNLSAGVAYGNSAIKKSIRNQSDLVISKTNPNSISLGMGAFLYEANVAYKNDLWGLKVGKFHYTYSDYNTNMGLYLLRGPVYPGFLFSGFEEIGGLTKVGTMFSLTPTQSLKWDVLATVETDFKPYMDLNLSSFLSYKIGMLELGTGFESQRLVEFNSCVTSPKDGEDLDECLGGDPGSSYVGGPGADPYKGAFFVIDTTGGKQDTTTFSLAGTKVMVRGALDFKHVMSSYSGSSKDMVLYFEAALLGVKDYPVIYNKKSERIPVLFGLNLPTWGLLDLASLEMEYYNSPYQNDPYKLVGAYDVFQFSDGNSINYAMSPIPPSAKAGQGNLSKALKDFDPKQDNLKWSLYLAKKVAEKVTLKAQLASDHWRVPNNNFVQYEVLAKPSQFYGSFRVDYAL